MKVQKHFATKVGDKTYYKHVIVIPEEILKQAEIKEGDELVASSKKGEIRLKKR